MRKEFLFVLTLTFMLGEANAYQAPPVNEMRGGRSNQLYPNQTDKDRTITKEIQDVFTEDYYLSPYQSFVQVYTIDGVVTLTGRLDSQVTRLRMVEKAKNVSGVRRVIDYIEVVHLQI